MRHLNKTLLLLCGLTGLSPLFARNYTVSGYLRDAATGETLISATVYDRHSGRGVTSNLYGFYSLTLPEDSVYLEFSYLGYLPHRETFLLDADRTLHVALQSNTLLEEVVIEAPENREIGVRGTQMSTVAVPVGQIKQLPALFGEVDVLKALQLLPGVQGGIEGSSGMYVRGGGPDENLVLLDGVPVYNVNHAGGFFSVFNADAIKNVTLYKGSFPARFGGRLSSVVDVRMNDGNDKEIHGNFSVGLISSKLNVEGPIVKESTTFNVSLRRTYSDLLVKPAMAYLAMTDPEVRKFSAGYYFYDLNLKLAHKFSDRDRLYLSLYSGDDAIYANVRTSDYTTSEEDHYLSRLKLDWKWGNLVSALRWNHVINPRLFLNTTASYTRYRFNMGINASDSYTSPSEHTEEEAALVFHSAIEDYTLKADLDWQPDTRHEIKAGANITRHTFKPGITALSARERTDDVTARVDTSYGDANLSSLETMFYIEDNIELGPFVKLNLGLHHSDYFISRRSYHSLQPRAGLRWLFDDAWSFKLGYARMNQYIHLLSNSSISLPTDLWVPVTRQIQPMFSQQYSSGLFYQWRNKVDFSLEAYYKTMDNLIEYKDGASFMGSSTGWEEKVCMGRGWAYGVEFLAQKSFGRTTGWLAYTWARSERLFDRLGQELNWGKVFPAKYDRRHDISLTASHKFSDRIDVSATWVYATGNCATLGLQEYLLEDQQLTYIESRNNYRYQDYHRLDLGINFHKKKKHGIQTWNLSIYNAYNQNNPFFVYTESEYDAADRTVRKKLMQVSIFTFIPSLNYSYKF